MISLALFAAVGCGAPVVAAVPPPELSSLPMTGPVEHVPGFRAVCMIGDEAFAVGEEGLAARVGATGEAVRESFGDLATDLFAVWASGANDVYAVGKDGAILHRDASGWTRQQSHSVEYLQGVWGTGPDDVYVVGDKGTILHSTSRGATWAPQKNYAVELLDAVWGSDPRSIFVGGYEGIIVHTTDGGGRWMNESHLATSITALWGSGANDIYAVGYGRDPRLPPARHEHHPTGYAGAVLHTTDGGRSWQMVTLPQQGQLFGLWGRDAHDLFAVGTNGVILRSRDGALWSEAVSGAGPYLYGITGDGRGNVWAVGDAATILRSNDGGTTWAHAALAPASEATTAIE